MALAEVKTIYESNARDIPAMLRKLADEVEKGAAGDHGEVREASVVTFGDKLCVFGFGDADGGSIHLMLAAAMRAMEAPLVARAEV
jgi:hypothetical protein